MREGPQLCAAFIRTLRPEPSDHRHEHGYRAVDDAPWRKDRPDEQHGRRDGGEERPDRWIWKHQAMVGLGVEHVRHQYVARVRAQPNNHGLIGWVFPDRLPP